VGSRAYPHWLSTLAHPPGPWSTLTRGLRGTAFKGRHSFACSINFILATDQFISPTGLRVRQDLYDEDYSDEDYEQMLSHVRGHHVADRRRRDRQIQGPPGNR